MYPGRLVLCAFALVSLTCAGGAFAKQKKKPEPMAVVAGTVFQESGRALPSAEVSLSGALDAENSPQHKDHAIANDRGEFAFYVPAKPGHYIVSVKARGFKPNAKPAIIQGDERVDVFIQLEPNAKGK